MVLIPRRLALRPLKLSFLALALVGVCACGDDGGGGGNEAAADLRPLAYVLSECTGDREQETAAQRLVVRQPDGERVVLKELTDLGPLPTTGLCQAFGIGQFGAASMTTLPFQRLGIDRDGSTVAFEVTERHSIFAALGDFIPDEEEGMFVVRSDGSDLRRIGPASREANFRFTLDPTSPAGIGDFTGGGRGFFFSPDGRTIAFTDLGPGPEGEDAIQIITIDLLSGKRTQVTRLPSIEPLRPVDSPLQPTGFVDATTVQFFIVSAAELAQLATVRIDGDGELTIVSSPEAIPGASVIPEFSITGEKTRVFPLGRPGMPANPEVFVGRIIELFVDDGENLLQLTSFRRSDTAITGNRLLSRDGQRVFFAASADPFGTNPFENCQFFSIDVLGANLQQLTDFGTGALSRNCFSGGDGCRFSVFGNERDTDTAIFASNCDPLGTNPAGGQIFRIHLDGSGLSQLTDARGMENPAAGLVTVELPGPMVYPETIR